VSDLRVSVPQLLSQYQNPSAYTSSMNLDLEPDPTDIASYRECMFEVDASLLTLSKSTLHVPGRDPPARGVLPQWMGRRTNTSLAMHAPSTKSKFSSAQMRLPSINGCSRQLRLLELLAH